MKYAILGLFTLMTLGTKSQNLVPNPSFEDYVICPWSLGVLAECAPPWFSAINTYPSYFNACANIDDPSYGVPNNSPGYQPARTGEAYTGIALYYNPTIVGINNARMYIETQLTESLEQDTSYCVGLYLTLAGDYWDMCAVANIGIHLSTDSIGDNDNDTLSYVPQVSSDPTIILSDTVNWTHINGIYQAQGGEEFITIGNFLPDDETNAVNISGGEAFYFIDDVYVVKCSQLTSINDLVEHKKFLLGLYPNPANTTITLMYHYADDADYEVKVMDITGRIVQKTSLHSSNVMEISKLYNGAYIVQLFENDKRVGESKLIILH